MSQKSISVVYADQINDYFHPLFSKLQCGFRKEFNTQHCLLVLIEECREVLDKRVYPGVLLIICQKLSTALIMNCYLQSYMHMVLVWNR